MKNNGFNKCDLISVLVLKILGVSNFSSKGMIYVLAEKYFYCHFELEYRTSSFEKRPALKLDCTKTSEKLKLFDINFEISIVSVYLGSKIHFDAPGDPCLQLIC